MFPHNPKGFMTWRGLQNAGMLGDPETGILLGRVKTPFGKRFLVENSGLSVAVPGPTGAGKSVLIQGTLMRNKTDSFVVIDPSGELWEKTSGIRSEVGPVYKVDPDDPHSARWNPLNEILPSKDAFFQIKQIYQMLVQTGGGNDAKNSNHFREKALEYLPAATQEVLMGDRPEWKNIGDVLSFVRLGMVFIESMASKGQTYKIREIAQQLAAASEKDGISYVNSIISTCTAAMALWDVESINEITKASSFSIADLAAGEYPMTVYLVTPSHSDMLLMPLYKVFMHLLKSHLLWRKHYVLDGRPKRRKVCVYLDEAEAMSLDGFESTLKVTRKFGVRWIASFQTSAGMKKEYGPSILDLLRIKVCLRPGIGSEDEKWMSSLSGTWKKEVFHETESYKDHRWQRGSRSSKKETKPRLEPADFQSWPEYGRAMLVRHYGAPAIVEVFDADTDPAFNAFRRDAVDLRFHPYGLIGSPWDDVRPLMLTHELPAKETTDEDKGEQYDIFEVEL